MPGSSLWLLPPSSHALQPVFTSLIRKTSSIFNSPHLFIPHITLTSSISPSTYEPDPQKWLDGLMLPSLEFESSVHTEFKGLESEDIFFKKLYVQIEKPGLEELAHVTRMTVAGYEDPGVARKWVEEEYKPHLSLLYHDCPKINEVAIQEIKLLVKEAGVGLEGVGKLGGWIGGRVVLVDTSKPIHQWVPIAERTL